MGAARDEHSPAAEHRGRRRGSAAGRRYHRRGRVLFAEPDTLPHRSADVLRCLGRRRARLSVRRCVSHWCRGEERVWRRHGAGEGRAQPAWPFALLLFEGHGTPGAIRAAQLHARGHPLHPAVSRAEGDRLRMPPVVAGIRRRSRYRLRDRRDQVGALEGRVRCLELHQELRRVSRGRDADAGVDGYDPGQAREPPLRRRSHADTAGRGGTAAPRRRGELWWMGDRSASERRRLQRAPGLRTVAQQRCLHHSAPHHVLAECAEPAADRTVDLGVTHRLRIHARDGDLRAQRAGRWHGRGTLPADRCAAA